jgi:hypothetical protein
MTTSSGRKHAGPGPASDQPPVPGPTFAERLEGLIAVGAGWLQGASRLLASESIVSFRLRPASHCSAEMSLDADVESREQNERLSLSIVGICFIALALYIT